MQHSPLQLMSLVLYPCRYICVRSARRRLAGVPSVGQSRTPFPIKQSQLSGCGIEMEAVETTRGGSWSPPETLNHLLLRMYSRATWESLLVVEMLGRRDTSKDRDGNAETETERQRDGRRKARN